MGYRSDISTIRHEAVVAAKDLCYGDDCIKDLKAAKTEGEISRIMAKARHGGYRKNVQQSR